MQFIYGPALPIARRTPWFRNVPVVLMTTNTVTMLHIGTEASAKTASAQKQDKKRGAVSRSPLLITQTKGSVLAECDILTLGDALTLGDRKLEPPGVDGGITQHQPGIGLDIDVLQLEAFERCFRETNKASG